MERLWTGSCHSAARSGTKFVSIWLFHLRSLKYNGMVCVFNVRHCTPSYITCTGEYLFMYEPNHGSSVSYPSAVNPPLSNAHTKILRRHTPLVVLWMLILLRRSYFHVFILTTSIHLVLLVSRILFFFPLGLWSGAPIIPSSSMASLSGLSGSGASLVSTPSASY